MSRVVKRTGKGIGVAPGTLIHVGNKINENVHMTMFEYSEESFQEKTLYQVEEAFALKENPTVKWINVDAIDKVEIIEKIGNEFKLHPLMLEDILNTAQRPKFDDYDDYLYIVLKMLYYNEKSNEITSEQVSFVLVPNYVFSLQEFEGDVFENVRERLRSGKRNIRKTGPDYLVYALIDAIVDSYFAVIEKIADKIDNLEAELIDKPDKDVLKDIHSLKREIIFLRNSIWPLREVINSLIRSDSPLIDENIVLYLRDVYDHTIQIIDTIEIYREILANMQETYISSISNRTNEIMKILTIFSAIFIPLTFLAGVYGMNFRYLPELEWRIGYGLFWIISIAVAFFMLRYFRKKKWL